MKLRTFWNAPLIESPIPEKNDEIPFHTVSVTPLIQFHAAEIQPLMSSMWVAMKMPTAATAAITSPIGPSEISHAAATFAAPRRACTPIHAHLAPWMTNWVTDTAPDATAPAAVATHDATCFAALIVAMTPALTSAGRRIAVMTPATAVIGVLESLSH